MKMKTMLVCIIAGLATVSHALGQEILNFRMVHGHNDELQAQAATGSVAAVVGYDVVTGKTATATNLYWVNKRWDLTDWCIASITVEAACESSASLVLKFTPIGARKLIQSTTQDQKRIMAVFVDRAFLTVWPITEPLTAGEMRINGLHIDEARSLKERFDKRQVEQSAAPPPSAPRTGPSEGAR
jgi:preprotein translocase subunit SecD